jgi:formylmethanofuran dehydrogenase subunit E
MTVTITLKCSNCKEMIGSVGPVEDFLDNDMVCLKCYNDLLKQLGMDEL